MKKNRKSTEATKNRQSDAGSYDAATALPVLAGLDRSQRGSWQLRFSGGPDAAPLPENLGCEVFREIFENLPSVPGLELELADGSTWTITRDFWSGHLDSIDRMMRRLFEEHEEIRALTFLGQSSQDAHTFTRQGSLPNQSSLIH